MQVATRAEAASLPAGEVNAHEAFILATRSLYAADVRWAAPGRGLIRHGREEVIRHLLREAGGMRAPDFTVLRRFQCERQVIDEYAVRFTYAGEGIDNAPIAEGDLVELKRVRILDLESGRVRTETCVETWTVLPRTATRTRF